MRSATGTEVPWLSGLSSPRTVDAPARADGTGLPDSDRLILHDLSWDGVRWFGPELRLRINDGKKPMTSTAEVGDQVVGLARGMSELVRAEAGESERMRTLTRPIVDEMWATGLMSAFNPVAAGGLEPSLRQMIETWIEMAWQDGSFGWIGIANLPSAFAAATYLPDEGFRRCSPLTTTTSPWEVSFFPTGRGPQCRVVTG